MSLYTQRYGRAFVMTSSTSAGSVTAQAADIASALRFIGIDAIELNVDEAVSTLRSFSQDSYFIVDMNNRAVFDRPLRKFSFILDHPCQVMNSLLDLDRQSVTLGWVDAGHIDGLAALGFPAHSLFLPHAGPDPAPKPLPMSDRDIDVLFSGSLGEPVDRAAWLARRTGVPKVLADVIFDTAAAIETTLDPVLNVFAAICSRHGVRISETFSRDALCTVIGEILGIAEINRRNAVLEALPDLNICIASSYLPLKLRDRTNIRHQRHVDFSVIRQLMARSKIVLNTTCKFPSGSHERIWYGIAEGAAILTDASIFVQKTLKHDDSLFFLPQRKLVPGDLAYLRAFIDDPARLGAIARNGGEIYARQHTWKRRISALNDAVQQQPPRLAA